MCGPRTIAPFVVETGSVYCLGHRRYSSSTFRHPCRSDSVRNDVLRFLLIVACRTYFHLPVVPPIAASCMHLVVLCSTVPVRLLCDSRRSHLRWKHRRLSLRRCHAKGISSHTRASPENAQKSFPTCAPVPLVIRQVPLVDERSHPGVATASCSILFQSASLSFPNAGTRCGGGCCGRSGCQRLRCQGRQSAFSLSIFFAWASRSGCTVPVRGIKGAEEDDSSHGKTGEPWRFQGARER